MKPTRFFSVLALLMSLGAQAELKVVDDLGGTSALAYYRSLNLFATAPGIATQLPVLRVNPYGEADMLPVHTPSLQPGRVTPRVHNIPGLRPLFLVGDDPLSRQWLLERIEVLRELKAVGLVINVQQLPALAELRRLGAGLDMAPVPADDLARRLGLRHYPVLVTETGLDQ
ncbi:integrating conjugative element protein [Pseudomonas vanderleydeniana]|uniref:Integrating conjugative element protein n=1 Tax=Pseudomonas vanderleydeniana TaxID=2745495 RepID=A0A9E6PR64_9PSED|nr:integrating conjugative element protein [Pseudomonas vanderleydeniana]QXI31206.1 integrating conjugative element protein [Pseudomonas vanderleydeniana]